MRINQAMLLWLLAPIALSGCVGHHEQPEPSTRPIATDVDPAMADPDYWYAKPGIVSVPASDYDRLWQACQQTLLQRRFATDRMDYRSGVMSSVPLSSKQFWELWRSDVVGAHDLVDSTINSERRTIRFELQRQPDGSCSATPKVVVERFTSTSSERRSAAAVNYRGATSMAERQAFLPPQTIREPGVRHWYALGRDAALEQSLARDLQDRLSAH